MMACATLLSKMLKISWTTFEDEYWWIALDTVANEERFTSNNELIAPWCMVGYVGVDEICDRWKLGLLERRSMVARFQKLASFLIMTALIWGFVL